MKEENYERKVGREKKKERMEGIIDIKLRERRKQERMNGRR